MCAASDNIFLIGFMGAGKSAVGKELARLGGYRLVDLDDEIVRRRGKAIAEIFATEGEEVFREYEAATLRSLSGIDRVVVATGGGIVGREENWAFMRCLGVVVFLHADWQVLRRRIGSGEGRPLAARDEPSVHRLWEQRLPLYRLADLQIDTDALDPSAVARRILHLLPLEKEQ